MLALEGVRVVEFGRFIAAPYCCQLLADAGAEVIKVEPMIGDDARRNGTRISETEARQYLNKNRNKRSLACDLSDERVRGWVGKLLDSADVVVANFRPGQAEKLGFDYATLCSRNPRLIYAENTGFGLKGPLSGVAGMDMALQGYSGMAHLTRHGPEPLVDPVIDYTAALLMAWGISTALYHRERSGEGQKLDVSLLQAALVLQNNHLNHIDVVDAGRQELVEWLKTAFAEGRSWSDVVDRQRAGTIPGPVSVYYGFFETRDSMLCVGGGSRPLQTRMLEVLGLQDPWVTDAGFSPDDPFEHVERMAQAVKARLRQEDAAVWLRRFADAGIPVSEVRLKAQVLDDEQAWENEYFTRLTHPTVGPMTVVSPPLGMSATPLTVRSPSPGLGQHTTDILQSAGASVEQIEAMAAAGVIVTD